jgi:prephenate dehydrogenase
LQKAHELWTRLGCKVLSMTPEQHDSSYAAVSHLPHLIAFALMNAISSQPEGQNFLSLAGPGFRDFTRIAASDPKIWRDILLSNHEELLVQSKIFQRSLQALEVAVSSGNAQALEGLIEQASMTRAHWSMNSRNKT